MTTQAMIGYGSQYEIMDGGGWVAVAEVFNIKPPSYTASRVEATNMDSPDRTREYIPGMLEPGAASFQMNFVPGSSSDQLIRDHQQAGTQATHRITFPNGITWSFTGSIESYEPDAPTDDRLTATVSVIVSGNITEGP